MKKIKKINKTMYLYNTEDVPKIPEEIIKTRIDLLNNNLKHLLNIPYQTRDSLRINSIIKAIKFWENIND